MNVRTLLPCLLLSIAAIASISHVASGQETAPTRTGRFEAPPREPSRFQVIQLQQASALQAVEVLSNLFAGSGRSGFGGGQPETIIADPRTNSLVIRASDEVLQQMTDIIKVLDAPQPAPEVRVFQLRHIPASEAHNALTPVAGADVKIAVDAVGNRVIVQGNAETLEVVQALLLRLDEPPPERADADPAPAPAADVQVRLVWLVAGLKDSPAPPPPADLENVVKELEKMGVVGLKTAAQIFVKTVPATAFNVNGSALLNEPCTLEVSGMYGRRRSDHSGSASMRSALAGKILEAKAEAQPAILEISVKARPNQGESLADLQTTITAPEGHSVVLGVSPVGDLTSVFVVQLRK